MEFPANLKYTKEHEWAKVEGDHVRIGITDFAQDQLGDVVFVELPEVGSEVEQNETFGVIESVKAVSDLYSPVSGEVIEVNQTLADSPELVNSGPYSNGWMIVVKMRNQEELNELLTAEQYGSLVQKGEAD